MLFRLTHLHGVVEILPELRTDDRGFFARTWCSQEFQNAGLNPNVVQCSISFNLTKGTLRGMHYQAAPHAENKLVRCAMGAIYDVALDLRPESPTFK
ncbi:MAG: dTDP-4-dehydrorhamnose 3,5-epimerase family protein, partial [Bryobacterales bacterium]|nr:dTDP-4-dehydrorhamnose 3,5-epimerase family protein [Bryobacterales bacterium]